MEFLSFSGLSPKVEKNKKTHTQFPKNARDSKMWYYLFRQKMDHYVYLNLTCIFKEPRINTDRNEPQSVGKNFILDYWCIICNKNFFNSHRWNLHAKQHKQIHHYH